MKIDINVSADLSLVKTQAQRAEALGYDGIKIAELEHDPFLPLTLAAECTSRIELMTSVAVAFARNPMSMAHLAHDLNAFSEDRFILGLGTQVKPHVTRRFGMPWHRAPRQMREFINAMHHIFDCWYQGDHLDFQGEYYQHSLMPSTFTPKNSEWGRPRIFLSATGPLMTKVAAEAADGFIMHPFSTEKFIREVNLPAIAAGLAAVEMDRSDFEIDFSPMIASGNSDHEISKAIEIARGRIAFYGSTPGYRMVLDAHGWGELQTELNKLMKQHRSEEMAMLIEDDVLAAFTIVGSPDEVVDEWLRLLGDLIDRTSFNAPSLDDEQIGSIIERLHRKDQS